MPNTDVAKTAVELRQKLEKEKKDFVVVKKNTEARIAALTERQKKEAAKLAEKSKTEQQMKDQVDALRVNGIEAAYLNSTQDPKIQDNILQRVKQVKIKLLYVAPERLLNNEKRTAFSRRRFHPDTPLMVFHNILDDRQSQP